MGLVTVREQLNLDGEIGVGRRISREGRFDFWKSATPKEEWQRHILGPRVLTLNQPYSLNLHHFI